METHYKRWSERVIVWFFYQVSNFSEVVWQEQATYDVMMARPVMY